MLSFMLCNKYYGEPVNKDILKRIYSLIILDTAAVTPNHGFEYFDRHEIKHYYAFDDVAEREHKIVKHDAVFYSK